MKKKILLIFVIIIYLSPRYLFAQNLENPKFTLQNKGSLNYRIAVSPDQKYLAVANSGNAVTIWDITSQKVINQFSGHEGQVSALVFSTDSKYLFTGGHDKKVIHWDLASGSILRAMRGHDAYISDVEYNPINHTLISASVDKSIKVWDLLRGETLSGFYGHEQDVTCIAIDIENQVLMSSSPDLSIIFWDLILNKKIKHTSSGNSVLKTVSSPFIGGKFVSGGNDRSAYIWEMKNSAPSLTFEKQKSAIIATAFSPDGRYVALAGQDRTLAIYLVETGKLMGKATKLPSLISGLKFSFDGKYLFTSELTNGVKAWDVSELSIKIIEPKKEWLAGSNGKGISGEKPKEASKATGKKESNYDPEELGKNYLLLIAINDYNHWPPLTNAVKDAEDVKEILTDKYEFQEEQIFEVKNEKATLEGIHNAFQELRKRVKSKDNLMIYFSGHGFYNKELDEGYWIPIEAKKGKETDYLPNANLLKYIKALDSKHVFLVADACFSGSLFSQTSRGYVENVEQYRSRWALTSGRLEFVSDGTAGNNSPFATSFLKFLKENTKEKILVSELIQYVKIAVANNSDQTPMGNPLKNVGDEGGEFVLRKRKN